MPERSLKMENGGFEKERETTVHDSHSEEIHPAAPENHTPQTGQETSHEADCACLESQNECGCSSPSPSSNKPKVEVRTWVNPKGWMLLGMGVALVAWSAIFFTLSGLGII
ncbi:hypothetical protein Pcinc_028123 [Petrolisthes cinctipes]|uniref:Uncharacterized protein n=1 Tax=Petrolisthes cinctipes TaxID=88211 RepID=A0AAE1F3Q3_PETCI|nr:hypothetical protein Pcinc_028123 [Petrolisthes cinctipes]